MKNNLPNYFQIKGKRPPLPDKNENKFVYSKQKFSTPQFFFQNPIINVNRNLLNGIYSPQSKGNFQKRQNQNKRDVTEQKKNNKDIIKNKIGKDLDETQKINIKNQITKNDSFYPIKTNSLKYNHHIFEKIENHPNEQNLYEKRSYLRHKRVQSEPIVLDNIQTPNKQKNINKLVHFNDPRISTNIVTLKRQIRKNLQRSTSSSILKNKFKKSRINSVDHPSRPRNQSIQKQSVTSIQNNEDLAIKQINSNSILKKKYQNILNNLKGRLKQNRTNINWPINSKETDQLINLKQTDKFTDTLFPPNDSSLFGYRKLVQIKQGNVQGKNIKWIRINQLFPNNQIVIFQQNPQIKSQISIEPSQYGSNNLASALNSIKNCKSLLFKIFQTQKINEFGIYVVKIFQQNIWKYVIIDDKIPVVQRSQLPNINQNKKSKQLSESNQSKYIPAFLNLTSKKNSNSIQMWPLLLQKAYANYYSSYQTFHIGNQIDYLQQILGTPSFSLNFQQIIQVRQSFNQLHIQLQNPSSFALGQVQQEIACVPIVYNRFKGPSIGSLKNYTSKQNQNSLIYYDSMNNFNECFSAYQKLPTLFNRIHVFNFQKYSHFSSSIIGHYQQIHRGNKSNQIQRAEYSVRHFILRQNSLTLLSIRQKQKRFYQNSSFKYEYMWVRVILIQREFNGQYRWITGKYSNKKSINFQTFLNAGQYYFIIMPQWRETHCHELNFFLWTRLHNVKIQKVKYDPSDLILEKACMDLSQRKGKLSQVNAFICSYNYLNEDVGMIMQNINNQRTIGTVKVMRSINGLKANVQIVPINKQFYQISEQEQKKQKKKFKNNITISIPQQQSYTVVLKMKGGIDKNFFQVFDFGN